MVNEGSKRYPPDNSSPPRYQFNDLRMYCGSIIWGGVHVELEASIHPWNTVAEVTW